MIQLQSLFARLLGEQFKVLILIDLDESNSGRVAFLVFQ
jgi:hypothetical protein